MEIRKRIYETICLFDLFDRPLSDLEVHRYLIELKIDIKLVRKNLRRMIGKDLSRKGNFYCLRGQEELFDIYKKRKAVSKMKWRKAKFVGMVLRKMPYIKGVAVSQNLALDNAKETSDIDLFIITAKGKLWTARLFVNLILDLFRLRNSKSKTPICPNFLISKDSLSLEKVTINSKDIDLARIVVSMRPLFGAELFSRFLKENKWARFMFPNAKELVSTKIKINELLWLAQKILEVIFWPLSLFEKKLMKAQIKKLETIAKKSKNPMLMLNEKMAKMHYIDMREHYFKEWQKRVKSYS
jgi:hypothetical protein